MKVATNLKLSTKRYYLEYVDLVPDLEREPAASLARLQYTPEHYGHSKTCLLAHERARNHQRLIAAAEDYISLVHGQRRQTYATVVSQVNSPLCLWRSPLVSVQPPPSHGPSPHPVLGGVWWQREIDR